MQKNNNSYLLFLIIFFGVTVSLLSTSIKTSYQVFFLPMSEYFNLTRGEFAWSGTIFMAVFGISSPIVGYIADRIGPKSTIVGGIFCSGLIFILMSLISNFNYFMLIYGVGAAFTYTAISYVSLGVLVDEIDTPKIKSFIYAIVTNGAALGFVFLAPLWLYLGSHMNWREIYMYLGLFFSIPLTILSLFVTRIIKVNEGSNENQKIITQRIGFFTRVKTVFSNPNFLYLSLGFFGCGVSMAYIDIHFISQLKDLNYTPSFISMCMVTLGITEFIGGLIAGILCDKYPKRYVLSAFYLLRATAVFVLFVSSSQLSAILFSALFGLSFMGTVIGTSMLSLSIFGKDIKGFAFGFVWLFHQAGAVFATQFGADLFDANGNYQIVLMTTGCIAIFSSLLVLKINVSQSKSVNAQTHKVTVE